MYTSLFLLSATIKLSQTDTSTFLVEHNDYKCLKAKFKASLFITYVATLDNNKPVSKSSDIIRQRGHFIKKMEKVLLDTLVRRHPLFS